MVKYCLKCKKEIAHTASTYCQPCYNKSRKIPRPICPVCKKPTARHIRKYHKECWFKIHKAKEPETHLCIICGIRNTAKKFCQKCSGKYNHLFQKYQLKSIQHYERNHYHWCKMHQVFYQGFCELCTKDEEALKIPKCSGCGKRLGRHKKTCMECASKRIVDKYKFQKKFYKKIPKTGDIKV